MSGGLAISQMPDLPTQAGFSHPLIQSLMRSEPTPAEVVAFAEYQESGTRDQHLRDLHDVLVRADVRLLQEDGHILRSAALQLLTAARILACCVRREPQPTSISEGPKRCGWLDLPVELRRECLQHLQALSTPTIDAVKALVSPAVPSLNYIAKMQQHSILSYKMVERIFAYAADRRTIGYGTLPEATFLPMRLASDDARSDGTFTEPRLLDEQKWSFAAARRRWSPLDSRPDMDIATLGHSDIPWAAECFLRTIGLVEDLIELIPSPSERDES